MILEPPNQTVVIRSPWTTAFIYAARAGLFLLGAMLWAGFFDYGRLELTAYDWPKEAFYFEVIRQALDQGQSPWHVEVPAAYVREFPQFANGKEACRFLALPETVLSPHVLLLRYVAGGRFVLVHFLLLYAIGFIGCSWVSRRFQLSLLPFALLVLLFNFNGYITSHLAVGHMMCSGYFFLPFVAVLTLEWLQDIQSQRPGILLAMVFFAMFLQGSLHMVVWCWLFLALVVACNPNGWRSACWAVGLSGLLASFRLVPATVAYWNFKELAFGGGYPTLTTLAEALLVVRDPTYRFIGGIFWWEYDLYIGILGVVLLAYFGIYRRCSRDPRFISYRYPGLDVPMLVMAVLAIGNFFLPLFSLPLPLVNSERVTSRFIVIPFVMLLCLSVIRMQRELERVELGIKGWIAAVIGVVVLGGSLVVHSQQWAVAHLETTPQSRWHEMAKPTIVDVSDSVYVASVWVGVSISIAALAAWFYAWRQSRTAAKWF